MEKATAILINEELSLQSRFEQLSFLHWHVIEPLIGQSEEDPESTFHTIQVSVLDVDPMEPQLKAERDYHPFLRQQ